MNSRIVLCMAALAAGVAILVASAALAADPSRVSLFNGTSLDGWSVITCDAVVDQGEILIRDGNGLVQSQKKYADFVLEFEWKALKAEKWDSGVYFRYDTVPAGKPWPARYQANLRQGLEGNVGDLPGAKSSGLVKPGEWNRFKLTVRGTTASLEINGKPAWSADGLQGPREGYIALQAEVAGGGQFRFRNLFVAEIK